jgi:energy-coupling factor transport system permease protein
MESFEYQRYITIGQYIPSSSPVHKLDPRTRIAGVAVLLIAVTLTQQWTGLLLALLSILAITVLARVPLSYTLKGLLTPLPFIVALALLQALLGPEMAGNLIWSWGPFNVSRVSLINGLVLLLRFPALILLIGVFSAATSTTEIVRGLEALLGPLAKLRLPVQDFVLMVQVALRFLPLLALEAERITKAQASRGAEWGVGRSGPLRRARQALPVIVPLFLVSLQRAENLALAMEARGYRSHGPRTSLIQLRFKLVDALAMLLCLVSAVLIFVL